jgi:hypothetical protein
MAMCQMMGLRWTLVVFFVQKQAQTAADASLERQEAMSRMGGSGRGYGQLLSAGEPDQAIAAPENCASCRHNNQQRLSVRPKNGFDWGPART